MFAEVIPPSIAKTVQILFLDGNQIVSSGTGFFFCNYLITCHHVFWGPENTEVVIRFSDANPGELRDGVRLSYPEFRDTIVTGSPENELDFAILSVEKIPEHRISNFTVPKMALPQRYSPVAVIGYPFGRLRPAAHHCYISNFYQDGPAQMMQLEGSINFGNSGGPVVALAEQAVIGYISTKEHGFTDKFRLVRKEIHESLNELRQIQEGKGNEAMIAELVRQQKQIQQICWEMLRSSNTGIGGAIRINHLLDDPVLQKRQDLWWG